MFQEKMIELCTKEKELRLRIKWKGKTEATMEVANPEVFEQMHRVTKQIEQLIREWKAVDRRGYQSFDMDKYR